MSKTYLTESQFLSTLTLARALGHEWAMDYDMSNGVTSLEEIRLAYNNQLRGDELPKVNRYCYYDVLKAEPFEVFFVEKNYPMCTKEAMVRYCVDPHGFSAIDFGSKQGMQTTQTTISVNNKGKVIGGNFLKGFGSTILLNKARMSAEKFFQNIEKLAEDLDIDMNSFPVNRFLKEQGVSFYFDSNNEYVEVL